MFQNDIFYKRSDSNALINGNNLFPSISRSVDVIKVKISQEFISFRNIPFWEDFGIRT